MSRDEILRSVVRNSTPNGLAVPRSGNTNSGNTSNDSNTSNSSNVINNKHDNINNGNSSLSQ